MSLLRILVALTVMFGLGFACGAHWATLRDPRALLSSPNWHYNETLASCRFKISAAGLPGTFKCFSGHN